MNFIISKKHIVLASLTLALSIAVYINFVFAKNENKIDRIIFNVFKPEDKYCYEQFLQ